MIQSSETISKALFRSLIAGPLLLEDLPEGNAFPTDSLILPQDAPSLNLKQKLGYLYEDALAAMLESTPRYGSVERGIQLRREAGHTLGELDFLLRDLSSGRLLHLELALKFYLAVETEHGFLLPGPDARDNYFRKLEKMRSHQLVLVEKFRDLLPERFQGEEILVRQLVQGCVFNHVNASRPVVAEFLNPLSRRGKWLHAKECTEYFGKDAVLEIIPKPLWPVPLELIEEVEMEKWQADQRVDRCVMVRSDADRIPHFIAPNGYPVQNASSLSE